DPQSEEGIVNLKDNGTEVVLIIPQITHDSELATLQPLLEKIKDAEFNVACSNLGAVELAKTSATPFVVQKELNTFNMFTARTFYEAGAYRVTLSSELNLEEITDICDGLKDCRSSTSGTGQVEIVIHGRELLLVTENDLLKPLYDKRAVTDDSEIFLIDRDDSSYPVKRWGTRTLIYNSEVLYMLDEIGALKECGADVLRLDLSLNNKKEVREITRAYKRALSGNGVKLSPKRDEIYTKGHYFKGI
ncbi:MAG: U32 family peptidase, partial [Methanosarcinales archaeon]|nr:U32 family peptidase [Methanosarcinales archaeon]